jgi:hypothetical protein
MEKMPKMKKLGFIIANDNEEFLHKYFVSEDSSGRAWSITPELALIFRTRAKAEAAFKELEKEVDYRLWILVLFETKKQLMVGSDEDIVPDWL